MKVRILHFASFRDAAGRDEETREIPEGSRVGDLWTALARDIALFARYPSIPPAAINREYASADAVLREDDEVAFLPPIAGG
jgi:molybdopterin converting factor subunit 1